MYLQKHKKKNFSFKTNKKKKLKQLQYINIKL